jgi:sec-independent protein translocase protein TatA
VVLVRFGPKRLPEMGRMLGKGMREYKDGITHHHERADEPTTTAPKVFDRLRDHDTI